MAFLRRIATGFAVGVALAAGQAGATDVKFSLDWAFQGPQAPFL